MSFTEAVPAERFTPCLILLDVYGLGGLTSCCFPAGVCALSVCLSLPLSSCDQAMAGLQCWGYIHQAGRPCSNAPHRVFNYYAQDNAA